MAKNDIKISFSNDELLVLYDYLTVEFKDLEIPSEKLAPEKIVLLRLIGKLEGILVEPFDKKYESLVKEARDRIQNKSDVLE